MDFLFNSLIFFLTFISEKLNCITEDKNCLHFIHYCCRLKAWKNRVSICWLSSYANKCNYMFDIVWNLFLCPKILKKKKNEINKNQSLILMNFLICRKPLFKYCYECGRSVGVRLSACTRCKEVYYCGKSCKLAAWKARHSEECIRVGGQYNRSRSWPLKIYNTLLKYQLIWCIIYSFPLFKSFIFFLLILL